MPTRAASTPTGRVAPGRRPAARLRVGGDVSGPAQTAFLGHSFGALGGVRLVLAGTGGALAGAERVQWIGVVVTAAVRVNR